MILHTIKGGEPLIKKLDRLYNEIEIKRHMLHERIKVYQDFTHPMIVQLSQELDQLLNEINVVKKMKPKK
ncbi:aspartyl-phosphate phosphatase Spo0E family protein [Caldalkalibacillus mannanilyticus]|uniref:aspartyl-phosphate phosphatase Spo0E family protein n=1 Tax=Caldalkalibacillus mannanilyticus TaxID=1418 RepID=UPI0034E23D03